MSDQQSNFEYERAHESLHIFVAQAELALPEVQTYEELEAILTPEVTQALAVVIETEGTPSNVSDFPRHSKLEVRSGYAKVTGILSAPHENGPLNHIILEDSYRSFFRFKSNSWVALDAQQGLGPFSNAGNSTGLHMPYHVSERYASSLERIVGTNVIYTDYGSSEVSQAETGFEMAHQARYEAIPTLNSFLEITSALVKRLVSY